jgi:transcription antitermination factor NusA-like protein
MFISVGVSETSQTELNKKKKKYNSQKYRMAQGREGNNARLKNGITRREAEWKTIPEENASVRNHILFARKNYPTYHGIGLPRKDR